jgi:pyruvate dehydrogenase E2 component (dihydrolipoamide acetyltransferase)
LNETSKSQTKNAIKMSAKNYIYTKGYGDFMANVVIMPKVGISVESCIITKWHKQKGDTVKEGEILFSYETDKASVDEESKFSGTLLELFCAEGDEVPVLQNVCVIGNPGESIAEFMPASAAPTTPDATPANVASAAEQKATSQAGQTAPATEMIINEGKIKVSPRAKNLSEKAGVDLRMTVATGPEGRVIERDVKDMIAKGLTFTKAGVEAFKNADITGIQGSGIGGKITASDSLAKVAPQSQQVSTPQSNAPEFEAVKLNNVRKFIAKSMVNSLNTMAQLTLNASFDASEIMKFRATLKNNGAAFGMDSITINDMMLFAVARTLKNHKDLNANLVDDTMYYYNDVNLGVAVDTERGLMVPTLFAADKKSLSELSKQAKALITDSQKGSISPDLLKGGTFTVTNLGTLDVESFTPVINPPQTGILGVCNIVQKVREVNGVIKTYPSMGLSLTFDHRAIDGAPAAKFLKELKYNLENFSMLLAK